MLLVPDAPRPVMGYRLSTYSVESAKEDVKGAVSRFQPAVARLQSAMSWQLIDRKSVV